MVFKLCNKALTSDAMRIAAATTDTGDRPGNKSIIVHLRIMYDVMRSIFLGNSVEKCEHVLFKSYQEQTS